MVTAFTTDGKIMNVGDILVRLCFRIDVLDFSGSVFVYVSPHKLNKAGVESQYAAGGVDEFMSDTKRDKFTKPQDTRGDEFTEPQTVELVLINTEKFSELIDKSTDNTAEQENQHIESLSDTIMDCISTDDLRNTFFPKKNDVIEHKVPSTDKWITATVLGRAGKSTGNHKDWYNI